MPSTVAFVWSAGLNLGLGAAEVLLGLIVIVQLRRFGRTLPWLVVLMAFFLVRGGDRMYVAFAGREPVSVTTVVDGAVILVLVLLLLGIRKTMRALELLDRDARVRQHEYARALLDYRQLVRHRLANPLTAISGAIATLEARPDLEDAVRAQLLRTVREAAERLERVALEPDLAGAEEQGLDARPRPVAVEQPEG